MDFLPLALMLAGIVMIIHSTFPKKGFNIPFTTNQIFIFLIAASISLVIGLFMFKGLLMGIIMSVSIGIASAMVYISRKENSYRKELISQSVGFLAEMASRRDSGAHLSTAYAESIKNVGAPLRHILEVGKKYLDSGHSIIHVFNYIYSATKIDVYKEISEVLRVTQKIGGDEARVIRMIIDNIKKDEIFYLRKLALTAEPRMYNYMVFLASILVYWYISDRVMANFDIKKTDFLADFLVKAFPQLNGVIPTSTTGDPLVLVVMVFGFIINSVIMKNLIES